MRRALLGILLGSAAYGFALGSAHSELYALRNVVKLPLLVVVTTTVCSLSYWIAARAFRAPLGFREVQVSAWRLFQDLGLLLGSLSPAVFFVARVARATDDGKLGDYDAFLALNMACVAASGTLALVRQASELLAGRELSRTRASFLVGTWLALSLFVGGQAAFSMRPFFGFPATRGNVPPWFLGHQADLRGATNFYESVWQTIRQPPLPGWLRGTSY
ncbi:MAG: hypothetical protein HZA53_10415 [Planctomycetes bacterium]|nr:hypothetical protein [Planctomycetota bacterium]